MSRFFLTALIALPVFSCGTPEEPAAQPGDKGAPKAQTVAVTVEEAAREVRCGCKIDSVGHCGNFVAVDGDWVEISNPSDFNLGNMEWCRVPADVHPKAVVAGERTGDKIALSKLDVQ